MKSKERIIWIALVLLLLVITTASALNNRIFAGDTEKAYESLRIFNEIFNLLRTEYYDEEKTVPESLTQGAINGMIESLDDPHTAYMTKEMFSDLQTETKGEFGGVGIVIGVRKKWITVISPIDDTPGARAGIKAGDKIIKIDGESTEGFTTMDAVNLIRGRVGTAVILTIKRESIEEPIDFEIVRGIIQLESVKSETIDDHIGYVRITSFSEHTADALKDHLKTLTNQDVDSLIIDLRNNPGGLLSSAIEISDMFIDHGTIVSIKGRIKQQNQVYEAHERTVVPDMPLIVLVNEGSASGSEIVAGAIKDNNRGILVGTKTFGKGSVQTVRELPDGSGIRITTALYYTPSGVSIHEVGIAPDEEVREVEITEEESRAIEKINDMGLIKDFVEKHEKYSDKDFERFMNELSENGIELKPVIVRRLIKNELERDRLPDLIDLDYDVQLKHSVDMIKSKNLFTKAGSDN
jgi:carboxyl-terminal processing protease